MNLFFLLRFKQKLKNNGKESMAYKRLRILVPVHCELSEHEAVVSDY